MDKQDLTNALLAGNLYTSHKIGKQLAGLGENQKAMHASIKATNRGISNLNEQISNTNNLLEQGLEVQTGMAAQQQLEYLEKQQNDLIRETFFNISQEYKKINGEMSSDILNKHLHLCCIKASIKANNIDSSIVTSMEDKTMIVEIVESIDKDIESTFNAFSEKHKYAYNQMLEILEKNEEKEISELENNIITAKKNLINIQFLHDGAKIIEEEVKPYVDFVEKNLLYSTVILFKDDLYHRYKNKEIMKVCVCLESDLKGSLEIAEDDLKAEINWFDGQKYFRGNTLYEACYYSKVLKKYTAIHELDEKNNIGFIEIIQKLIEKNISILSNPIYLEFRKNLVFRCFDKKKWEICEKTRKMMNKTSKEHIPGNWWINMQSIEVEVFLTPENIKALETLFKILNKAYELTKIEMQKRTDNRIRRNEDLKKEIEKMESKINKLKEIIQEEKQTASNLYKDYPAMKQIIKNR